MGLETSCQSPLGLQKIMRKIPFLKIYHLGNFDDFIESGFWVIPKNRFANLWKSIHDVIIIPVSSDPLNLETVERKEKNPKNQISQERKELFRQNKNHFS